MKKMNQNQLDGEKILLINPSYQPHWSRCEPTGLLYLASFLEQYNLKTDILDLNVTSCSDEDIIYKVMKENYRVIGITAITRQANQAYKIGKALKQNFHERIVLVYGGVHPTLMSKEAFEIGMADYVVRGEGEQAFYQLCESIVKGKPPEISIGLCIRKPAGIIFSEEYAQINNLDELPFPDLSKVHLSDYNTNIHLPAYPGQAVHVLTSRGCTGSCYYCASPRLYSGKVRYRSPENVMKELISIVNQQKIHNVHFHDDNIFEDAKKLETLCRLILNDDLKFNWIALATVKHVNKNKTLLPLMRRAGCVGIEVGIESGDENVLRIMNKNSSLESIQNAVKILKDESIHPMFLIMSYSLGETIDSAFKSARLFYELKNGQPVIEIPIEHNSVDPDLAGHLARPSPGSVFYGVAEKFGRVFSSSWNDHVEEKMNFIPNSLLDDIPEIIIKFKEISKFRSYFRRYKKNLELYANQNFYISKPLMKVYFDEDFETFIDSMYMIYEMIDNISSIRSISKLITVDEKDALIITTVAISIMSIFGIVRSGRGR
ncbi:MAG: B12-binding domain-containing radical SAM protein [Nanoarchaeota archaeon]|nr:B12-binding domain-containing radical SAM protein [Nanoarchaeota archaeon]